MRFQWALPMQVVFFVAVQVRDLGPTSAQCLSQDAEAEWLISIRAQRGLVLTLL